VAAGGNDESWWETAEGQVLKGRHNEVVLGRIHEKIASSELFGVVTFSV
jgi:hypothetical protein